MQITIGDKVRFLNDVGGGTVTRIIDANTVMVLNEEDEFEIPSLKRNLVVIESSSEKKSEQATTNQATVKDKKHFQTPLTIEKEDVYIAFVPKEDTEPAKTPLELYLINDTEQILLYSFFHENNSNMEGVTTGNLDPRSKILLTEYDSKALNDFSSCFFQILFYQKGIFKPVTPLERTVKIQPVKFYKENSYNETAYFHQDAILYKLTEESMEEKLSELSQKELNKVIREKQDAPVKKQIGIKPQNEILEVDLHINVLIDSVTGLSNADILEYQLNKFHEVMQNYQNEKGKKIVFIHGIGNGTLKAKVQSELKRKYKKHYQQDASFKEYGWGATMVTIR